MELRSWSIVLITNFCAILMLCSTCYSEKAPNYSFVRPATEAPLVSHFDYIVVGGGTSGCALAATLSEGAHVLVLERGGSPYGNNDVEEMTRFGAHLDDNSNSSVAQQFVSEDGVFNARARILGGGSALNAGFYTRASPGYVARAGWSGALVNESYEWVERKVAFKPPMLGFQSAFRDGLLEVGVRPYNGFTYDHMYGTKVGGTIFDSTDKRHTAADLLEYAHPDSTTVYLFATVLKILFSREGQYCSTPRAHGVTFRDSKGIKHKAYLKPGKLSEIIISAGAIGSPQILMLSGVGPAKHLKQLGIKVVADQPMVGQGMADNPMNAIIIPSPIPVEASLVQAVGITEFDSYIEAASGASFANVFFHNISTFAQTSKPLSYAKTNQGTHYDDPKIYEFINSMSNEASDASIIVEKTMGPISSGQLYLKTTNPNDNPSVTFNYFKEQEDLTRCVKGMEIIIKVIESKSLSNYRFPDSSVQDLLNAMLNYPLNRRQRRSDDSEFSTLEQYCKDTVMTIWHYHGGCQVGGVVDKDYKVFNVSGLRVIDGSTFYHSPGTNPQATYMMLGRYMGQRILEDRVAISIGGVDFDKARSLISTAESLI